VTVKAHVYSVTHGQLQKQQVESSIQG